MSGGLSIAPISFRDAAAYVQQNHRHHKAPQGMKFTVAVRDETGSLRGVAIVGRPIARNLDDGLTLEVTRVCTDGAFNACSLLYGACRRIAREFGYRKILTYTLPTEGGASLRGAGWALVGDAGGGSWSRRGRPRETPSTETIGVKSRWESNL